MIMIIEPYPAAINAIERQLTEMGKESRIKDVLKKAVNETASAGKERIHKETKEMYTIKSGAFKKSDVIKKAPTSSHLVATLTIRGEPIGVRKGYQSRTNGKRKGASAMVLRSGEMKELKINVGNSVYKAFVATMKNGHKEIFQRVPGEKMKSNHKREAIKEIVSLSKSKAAEIVYQRNGLYTEFQAEFIFRLLKHMNAVIGG